jgi:hypothetical protein
MEVFQMFNRCVHILLAALTATLWFGQTAIGASDPAGGNRAEDPTTTNAGASSVSAVSPPAFTPAPHRNPPQVPNHDAEGKNCPPRSDCPAPNALRIVSIIPRKFPHAGELEKFGHGIAGSKWLAKFTAAFGIPGPALEQVILVDDMPDLNQGHKTVSDYRDYVFAKALFTGLKPAPQHQTIYVLYIPCDNTHKPSPGMDSFGCTSHHPAMEAGPQQLGLFRPGDSMALSLGFNPRTDAGSYTANNATTAATHELAEAVTDTRPLMRFNLTTNDPNYPFEDSGNNAGGSPWVREVVGNVGVMELADMAAGHRWYESGPDGSGPFEYARVYNNQASKAGGDPAVPAGIHPYYNVSTKEDWVTTTGQAATVSLTAWSAEGIGSWKVDAEVADWLGHENDPPAPAPCSLSTKHWTVHNGSHVDMSVDTTPLLPGSRWCVVRLKSTNNFTNGDEYHTWWVGVILKGPTPTTECICADGTKAGPEAHAGTEACGHICLGHEKH